MSADTTGLLALIVCPKTPTGYAGSGPVAGFPMMVEIRRNRDGTESVVVAIKSGTSDPLGPLPACDGWGFETLQGERVVRRK